MKSTGDETREEKLSKENDEEENDQKQEEEEEKQETKNESRENEIKRRTLMKLSSCWVPLLHLSGKKIYM